MSAQERRRLYYSAFIPFFRRWFTDEQTRELRETRQLYDEVCRRFAASPWAGDYTTATAFRKVIDTVSSALDQAAAHLPKELQDALFATWSDVIRLEEALYEPPEWRASMTMNEAADLRNALRAQQYFLANDERCSAELIDALLRIFTEIARELPAMKSEGRDLFTVPLVYLFNDLCGLTQHLIAVPPQQNYVEAGLFTELNKRFYENLCAASNVIPYTEHKKPFAWAKDSKLPPTELAETYLAGTPFHSLFLMPVPLTVTHDAFFSHMHVCGGTGAGKTQWLSTLILHHLDDPAAPALVVVESQGDLISKLARLKSLEDRSVLITPKDIKHPPAINVFDIKQARLGSYDDVTREQIVAGAIDTFDYLFSGLVGADLTAKQSVFFRFVCRLLLNLPETMGRNATILDMIALMEDLAPYQKVIEQLPPIQRRFFERDFRDRTFQQTKEQVRYRLNSILENPTMERLFTARETRLDLFEELNRGSVILIDTAKDFLKTSSSHFGRLFISLVLRAIMERAAIPEGDRKPAFLIVDEAAEYFDQNINDLLTQVRKYKMGCVFAHQFMDQCTQSLKSSLAANTAIKLASRVSTGDARALAPEMRTTPEFILSQPKLQFACYIRDVTTHAISVPVEAGRLERQAQMSDAGHADFLKRNRERVSAPEPSTRPGSVKQRWQEIQPAEGGEDVADGIDVTRGSSDMTKVRTVADDDTSPGTW